MIEIVKHILIEHLYQFCIIVLLFIIIPDAGYIFYFIVSL